MSRPYRGVPDEHGLRVGPPMMPSRQEAMQMNGPIRIAKDDLGAMTEIVRDLADRVPTDELRDLVSELRGYLEFLRLQLP